MKFVWFRVKNYKSVADSGQCYLSPDVTVLAGKNESGKTAILEALKHLNFSETEIEENAVPLTSDTEVEVQAFFAMTTDEISDCLKTLKLEEDKPLLDAMGRGILISKIGGLYRIGEDIETKLVRKDKLLRYEKLKPIKLEIESCFERLPDTDWSECVELIKEDDGEFNIDGYQAIGAKIDSFINESEEFEEEEQPVVEKLLKAVETLNARLESLGENLPSHKFWMWAKKNLPQFVFFSDIADILPFQVEIIKAHNTEIVRDFATVSGIDLELIKNVGDTQKRRNILSRHSASISTDFQDYYEQDKIELVAEPDGKMLRIGIKGKGSTILYKPEQRSKGLQWFVSFYLRVRAKGGPGKIILVDEPGLYLHAKAQKDVLKVLESHGHSSQVVFSTHSPYLIDVNRLDRVRLVIKEGGKTTIENKIHRGADKETLTPIMTAIGHDLAANIINHPSDNVIVEGPTDYYYMHGMIKLLGQDKPRFGIIPAIGATNEPHIISILKGWGLNPIALFDRDSEGQRVARKILESGLLAPEKVIFVSENANTEIEDLFTRGDFLGKVIEKKEVDEKNKIATSSNSQYMKKSNHDRVIVAKIFYEKCLSGDVVANKLTKTTCENFTEIIGRIAKQVEVNNK